MIDPKLLKLNFTPQNLTTEQKFKLDNLGFIILPNIINLAWQQELRQAFENIMSSEGGVIQDRTIYEDVEIFARNLHEMKFMTDRDWNTYQNLFKNMTRFLQKPDLIIYLKASTDTLLSRIRNRDRDFERDISPEYLHSLNIFYDQWISRCKDQDVLTINSDGFNIFTDKNGLQDILNQIEKALIK